MQAAVDTDAKEADLDDKYPVFQPPVAHAPGQAYRTLDPGVNLAAELYDSEGFGHLHRGGKVWPSVSVAMYIGADHIL